jgi:hypothetical protein
MANPQVTAEEHGGAKKSKKRGSTDNSGRLAGLRPEATPQGNADWGAADPRWVAAVVAAATLRGCILSFSLSRDGGAHGLSLYTDGERVQLWFNGDADLDVELEKVFEYLESMK